MLALAAVAPLISLLDQPRSVLITIGAVIAVLVVLIVQGWWRHRLAYLASVNAFGWRDDITPLEFEQRCAIVLRSRGWEARTTKGSGDQGVDVLAAKGGLCVVIQCKRYRKPVGNKAVQEALAGMAFSGAHRAAVVSNAGYTPAARELAGRTGVHLMHYTDLERADAIFRVPSEAKVIRPCRKCGAKLRLPSGRSGAVTCPVCSQRTHITT